ncbi:MAG TPA: hypothetical protein VFU37_22060 [Pyrinomonadaceae bacterium]|nr:hypothetical protein [Pyrinomonadaceae bacterium]
MTIQLTRRRARLPLKLPIQVVYRETPEHQWTESSRLIDVNHFGAGFTLTRPIDVGRLVQLIIPLPYQLRCFDYSEPMYSVWSLVRHSSPMPAAEPDQPPSFRIGVGFIGKHPPLSYEMDPTVRFEPLLLNMGASSLWRLARRKFPNKRRESRLIIPLEVLVETLDANGQPAQQEFTVTETLSTLGTCIPTNLDVGVGRMLRISSPRDGISIFAVIRSRKVAPDGIARLGLEFVGNHWPLHREAEESSAGDVAVDPQRRIKPSQNGSSGSK